MKKFTFIFSVFFIFFNVFSQQKEKSFEGIELPEFIIVGIEKVEIPKAIHGKADLLPILSSDFIQPTFSEEDLPTFNFAMRDEYAKINLAKKVNALKGSAEIGAGNVTLPYGKAIFAHNPENFFFRMGLFGQNQREYKKKAGINSSGIDLNASYFSKNESKFLPSSKYDFGISYSQNSFNLFAKDSIEARKLTFGDGRLSYENNYFNNFKGGFIIQSSSTFYKQLDYLESVVSFSANLNYISNIANFYLSAEQKKLSYDNNLTSESEYNYTFLSSGFETYVAKNLRLGAGLSISNIDYDDYFAPYGQLSFKINENFSLYGEFSPTAVLLTQRDLFSKNRYAELDSSYDNFLFKKNGKIKSALKYEERKNFSVTLGASFFTSKKYPFYRFDSTNVGFKFSFMQARCVELFLSALYQSDYLGYFSADLFIRSFRDKKSYFIPNESAVSIEASYNYKFPFGLSFLIGARYDSQKYFGEKETYQSPPFFNIYAHLNYQLYSNLHLFIKGYNLLNQKNYYVYKYLDSPIDIIVGVNYKWE